MPARSAGPVQSREGQQQVATRTPISSPRTRQPMPRNRRKFPVAVIEANLTPMIDVTFLLIVFFTLVSGIADNERVDMALSRVPPGASAQANEESRVMLNVIPATDGRIGGYLLAGETFDATPDGVARLADTLAGLYRRNPNLAVHLRADRATLYEWVEPAMRATTTAASLAGGGALPRLNLVVLEEVAPEEMGSSTLKSRDDGGRGGT